MTNANVNMLPPRSGGAAPQRSIVVTGAGEGVGTTTVCDLLRAAGASAFPPALSVGLGDPTGAGPPSPGAGAVVSVGAMAEALTRFAEAAASGSTLIYLQVGAAMPLITQARAVKLGSLTSKSGLVVVVVAGPAPSTVPRARALLRLLRDGSADLGVAETVVVWNDTVGVRGTWHTPAHRQLLAEIEAEKIRTCAIGCADLTPAERLGFAKAVGVGREDPAANLGPSDIAATISQALFQSWVEKSTEALKGTGILSRPPAVKAA